MSHTPRSKEIRDRDEEIPRPIPGSAWLVKELDAIRREVGRHRAHGKPQTPERRQVLELLLHIAYLWGQQNSEAWSDLCRSFEFLHRGRGREDRKFPEEALPVGASPADPKTELRFLKMTNKDQLEGLWGEEKKAAAEKEIEDFCRKHGLES